MNSNKTVYEYKRDILQYNTLDALIFHLNKAGYNFNLQNAVLI